MDGFVRALIHSVSSNLGSDVEITTSEQKKNNQITYPCLTIRHPDRNISPNIRLDELFDTYKNGNMNLEEITERISSAYNSIDRKSLKFENIISDPEKVSDKIFYRLVNYERNCETLETYPHFRILDLAVVFCIYVPLPNEETGSVRIDDKIAKLLGFDAGKLLALAVKNTPAIFPTSFEDLDELLVRIMRKRGVPDHMIPLFMNNGGFHSPMKVLTNDQSYYGASCILYPGVLENIRKDLGHDLYIIPSSVNEVIILPASTIDAEHLNEMVKDVNSTVIPPDQILSDNIYRYPHDFGPEVIGPFTAAASK